MTSEREQYVGQLAHRIWEAEGRPAGQEKRHWYMALKLVEAEERVLESGTGSASSPASAPDEDTD